MSWPLDFGSLWRICKVMISFGALLQGIQISYGAKQKADLCHHGAWWYLSVSSGHEIRRDHQFGAAECLVQSRGWWWVLCSWNNSQHHGIWQGRFAHYGCPTCQATRLSGPIFGMVWVWVVPKPLAGGGVWWALRGCRGFSWVVGPFSGSVGQFPGRWQEEVLYLN